MAMMQTNPTPYAEVNELVALLLAQIKSIFGQKLVGLYLYGSLVTGDFDPECSDIDLVAALSSDIDEQECDQLRKMHNDFAQQHRQWDDRIEVVYLSANALQTYRSQISQIAVISPGESLYVREAGSDWLLNWYIVREKGMTLFGPSPKLLIDPISQEEVLSTTREEAKSWREWIKYTRRRGAQAFAILTMCRAFYTLKEGGVVSKKRAATWAEKEWPEWSSLIQRALVWREEAWSDEHIDHDATLPETRQFVSFAIDQCERL